VLDITMPNVDGLEGAAVACVPTVETSSLPSCLLSAQARKAERRTGFRDRCKCVPEESPSAPRELAARVASSGARGAFTCKPKPRNRLDRSSRGIFGRQLTARYPMYSFHLVTETRSIATDELEHARGDSTLAWVARTSAAGA